MDIVKILLRQLVIMFLFILIGCGLFKTKRISIQGSKDLGTMLLYVILPCVIVNSYIGIERDSIIMIGMVISFVAAAISLILSIIISRIAFGNKYKIEHFGSAFSNAGFMGIPIVQAVIGTDAVIYIYLHMLHY